MSLYLREYAWPGFGEYMCSKRFGDAATDNAEIMMSGDLCVDIPFESATDGQTCVTASGKAATFYLSNTDKRLIDEDGNLLRVWTAPTPGVVSEGVSTQGKTVVTDAGKDQAVGTGKPNWFVALVSVLSMGISAYHGYKRNRSVGWAIGWGLFGGIVPVIGPVPIPVAPILAAYQGFAKPKRT